MGKGDRRSKKGKIWRGSYGKTRPKAKNMPTNDNLKKSDDQKEEQNA